MSQLPTKTTDPDGLVTYEYIANHIDTLDADTLNTLVDTMIVVDGNGQFLSSAARYLHATDPVKYAEAVKRLVASVIERDREHRYMPDLLPALWGVDYAQHVDSLSAADDNFRRIYKRLYPRKF